MIQKALILSFLFGLNSLFSQGGYVYYEGISKKYSETAENKVNEYLVQLNFY